MICELLREQLSLYAGGDLPANETETVAEHLADCAECRLRLAQLQETISLVGLAAADARYPSAQMPRVRWTRRPAWRAAVAAAVVGAILIGTQVPAVVALGADVMGWVKSFRNLSVHEMTPAEAERFQQPIKPDPPGTWDENDPPSDTTSRPLPLAEIEAQIDYHLLKPTYLPDGFRFEKSHFTPLFQDVLLEYSGPAGQVMLRQSSPNRAGSMWVKAPEVEMVRVGDGEGALTRSTMRLESTEGEVFELPRLALYVEREDGRVVSVDWTSADYPVAEIVKLVESLYAPPEPAAAEPVQTCFATKPASNNKANGVRYEPKPLAEIEAAKGWKVLTPSYLPDGYTFNSSEDHSMVPDVLLTYSGPLGTLVIGQALLEDGEVPKVDAPACGQEQVKVGDLNAVLVKGGWMGQPDGSWSWIEKGAWLQFVRDGRKIGVIGFSRTDHTVPTKPKVIGPVSAEELIKVAESLR